MHRYGVSVVVLGKVQGTVSCKGEVNGIRIQKAWMHVLVATLCTET